MKSKIFINIVFVALLVPAFSFAQSTRNYINKGVDQYKAGKMSDAEVNFKKGVEKAPKNYTAHFNLGDAYYKQKKYDDAIKSYQQALAESKTNVEKANVYHNIGNALLKDKKIDKSIEAYKQALKLNPDDPSTKYNLSYALNQKNDKDNKNKNKKNQDKNKNDKNKKNDKDKQNKNDKDKNKNDKQDKKKDQNKDQQYKNKQDQKNSKKQPQPQKNQISKADAQRILNALKNNEKALQKKLRKRTGKVVKTEKDW
jgi:Tfp pilus assembly protein PilF